MFGVVQVRIGTMACVVLGGLLCVGCRDLTFDGGERIADQHILAGSRPGSRSILTSEEIDRRFFISRNTDLEPLRESLRRRVGGSIDAFGAIFFRAEGDVLLFDPSAGPRGDLEVLPTSLGISFDSVRVRDLRRQYRRLCTDPILGQRGLGVFPELGGGGSPRERCDPIPLRDLDSVFEEFQMRTRSHEVDLQWRHAVAGLDSDPISPVLAVEVPFDVEINQEFWTGSLMNIEWSRVELEYRLQPSLCGTTFFGTPRPQCRSDDAPYFLEYRSAGDSGDVVFPGMGADLRAAARVLDSNHDVTPTIACFFLIGPFCAIPAANARERIDSKLRQAAERTGRFVDTLMRADGLQRGGMDLGTAVVDINAAGGFPALRAEPFGAPGGSFTDSTMLALSRGARMRSPVTVNIPASPAVATMVEPTGNFALEARRIFAAPLLDAAARRLVRRALPTRPLYVLATSQTVGDEVAARFDFMLDFDGDGVDDQDDLCPTDPDPAQDDGDGDGIGDACDSCPGVEDRGIDRDLDGLDDACDCDADGDGCPEASGLGLGRSSTARCPPVAYPDDHPDTSNPIECDTDGCSFLDTDDDGLIDDCDPDDDGDGVLDPDDNCSKDANPDQLDTNGDGTGDACDPLCPGPGAPGCRAPRPPLRGLPRLPADGAMPMDRCMEGPFDACRLLGHLDPWCLWDDSCGGTPEPDYLLLHDADQRLIGRVSSSDLGLPTQMGPGLTDLPDLDFNGIGDLAVGSPNAPACRRLVLTRRRGTEERTVCNDEAGEVVLLSSFDGHVIDRVHTGGPGDLAGTALARIGPYLVIGAPGASRASGERTGAVFVYDLGSRRFVAVAYGREEGERFGESIAIAGDIDGDLVTDVLVGAPFATTAAGAEAGRAVALTLDGFVIAEYDGLVPGGRLGTDSSALLSRVQAPPGVLVGAPHADANAGLVVFYALDGTPLWSISGSPGDRLGASLASAADFDGDGSGEVAVGAPGADGGGGKVLLVSAFGTVTETLDSPGGAGFGRFLAVPGDVDHDGLPDLHVGIADVRGDGPGATYPGAYVTYLGFGGIQPPGDVIPFP